MQRRVSQVLNSKLFEISPEVSSAFLNGNPIVALESTIITHGMPKPKNILMAKEVERIIRKKGVTPATIAVLEGKVKIGCSEDDFNKLSTDECVKISRRDFPYVLANSLTGGTTVSGTSLIASSVGISTFVTGGLGGVHRGGELSLDVSTDLTELSRTPITVICAGIKSILDIGRTLEYLETMGVTVATLGPTKDFPSFFSPESGFKSPYKLNSIYEAAKLMKARADIELQSGIVIGVPVPEEFRIRNVESFISIAITEAEENGISGKEVTPFVLKKINELTLGKTLEANVGLVKNNAGIGAEIAKEYSLLHNEGVTLNRPLVTVVGGTNIDFVVTTSEENPDKDGSTNSGIISSSLGGVGRNIYTGLRTLNSVSTRMVSAIGNDSLSVLAIDEKMPVKTILDKRTASYVLVLNKIGEVKFAVGDMDIHRCITPDIIDTRELLKSSFVVLDGNIPIETIEFVIGLTSSKNIPVLYEPTDVNKADIILKMKTRPDSITYITPNLKELYSMVGKKVPDSTNFDFLIQNSTNIAISLLKYFQVIIITLGSEGILLVRRGSSTDPLPLKNESGFFDFNTAKVSATHYSPTKKLSSVVSASGAGDCLVSGFITALINNKPQDVAIGFGMKCAEKSLNIVETVPESFGELKMDPITGRKIH